MSNFCFIKSSISQRYNQTRLNWKDSKTFATVLQINYLYRIMKMKVNWDGLGIATSIICAIHCAILPLILSSFPLFGINIIHNVFFEWLMIAIAIMVGIYSLSHGYKKHHHQMLPIIVFSVGAFFLLIKQFTQTEYTFLFIAVICIISAHMINYRLCTRSKCSSAHHQH